MTYRIPKKDNFKDPFSALLGAKETGLDRQAVFQRPFRLFEAIPDDTELAEMISDQVLSAKKRDLLEPNPLRKTSPVDPDTFTGDILIGVIQPNNVPYFVPSSQLTTHCLVCGITGGSKTNLILLILCQLMKAQEHDYRI